MAHPKRKISKTRRDKRRTHYKAADQQIATCNTTGEAHLYHRAHWHEGKLFYKGKVLIVNVDKNNFPENPEDLGEIINLIDGELNGLF